MKKEDDVSEIKLKDSCNSKLRKDIQDIQEQIQLLGLHTANDDIEFLNQQLND